MKLAHWPIVSTVWQGFFKPSDLFQHLQLEVLSLVVSGIELGPFACHGLDSDYKFPVAKWNFLAFLHVLLPIDLHKKLLLGDRDP